MAPRAQLFSSGPNTSANPRRPGTIVSVLVHGFVALALLVPVGTAIQSGFFEQHLVYLVPPNRSPEPRIAIPSTIIEAPAVGHPGAGIDVPTQGPLDAPASRKSPGSTAEHPRIEDQVLTRAMENETALSEVEVDSAVVRDPTSAAPEYPQRMLAAGIGGFVTARYVVDTVGAVDTLTFTIMEFTHQEFAEAVRQALPRMHFRPALQHGARVRQWVEQTFHFRIEPKVP